MPDPLVVLPRHVLAFDTAMGGCSAAVVDMKTGQAVRQSLVMERGQSEILVPMIQGVVKEAGLVMADMGLVVTTVGPGGFTGLRIGLSAARSFGLALNIPVVGVRTTDVILKAAMGNAKDHNMLLVVIETKRDDFYVQDFGGTPRLLSADSIVSAYQNHPITLCGDGVIRLQQVLSARYPAGWRAFDDLLLPDPVVMAHMGYDDFITGKMQPPDPLYLREADVSQSKRAQRVIAEG